jgi:CheY-like chemotaxis protein
MPTPPDTQLSKEYLAAIIHKLRGPLAAISAQAETLAEGIFGPLSLPQTEAIKALREELAEHLHQIESLEELWLHREEAEAPPTLASELPGLVHRLLQRFSSPFEDRQLHLQLDETNRLPQHSPPASILHRVLHHLITCQIALVPKGTTLRLRFSNMPQEASPLESTSAIQTQLVRLDPVAFLLLQRAGTILVHAPGEQPPSLGIRLHDEWTCWIDPQPSSSHLSQSPTPQTASTTSIPLILLADDQAALSCVLGNYLEDLGFHVEKASDGFEVVRMARQRIPSLILMDLRMPLLSGIDALHQIRQAEDPAVQTIPVICMSGLATEKEKARCLAAGAHAFLCKPFRPADLLELLPTVCPSMASLIR